MSRDAVTTDPIEKEEIKTRRLPPYNLILENDDMPLLQQSLFEHVPGAIVQGKWHLQSGLECVQAFEHFL